MRRARLGSPGISTQPPTPEAARRTTRKILALLAVVLVLMTVLVLVVRPRSGGQRDLVGETGDVGDSVVTVLVAIDTVDAARGSMRVRISLLLQGNLPPEGFTVATTISAVPLLKVESTKFPPETTGEVFFDTGEVSAYPFDAYSTIMGFAVLRGTNISLDHDPKPEETLPFSVAIFNAAAGFTATGGFVDVGELSEVAVAVSLVVTRQPTQVVWACVMMGAYWILALAVVGVVLAILRRAREWESRHLAWLTAMVFAFAAFRNTAPGQPPVGVFFDLAAFFPATGVVALGLVSLVVYFLTALDPSDDPVTASAAEGDEPVDAGAGSAGSASDD